MTRRFVLAGAALAASTSAASATWSILIADTRTGEIAVASATCVPGIDLQANTPVVISGVGAATAQSFVEARGLNRTFVRDRLLEGVEPGEILTLIEDFDNGHQNRQYGILDVQGGTATFSGSNNSAWAGGVTGRLERGRPGPEDDIVYAVQGNILVGPEPVLAAEQAIRATPGDLGEKILAAMEAARALGGDGRCSCTTGGPTSCGAPPPEPFKSADVGYVIWTRAGDTEGCPGRYRLGATEAAGYATGDFDGDGELEYAAVPRTTGRVTIFESIVNGSTTQTGLAPIAQVETISANAVDMASGDVNSDGLDDLVVVFRGAAPKMVVLLANVNEDDGFREPIEVDLPGVPDAVLHLGFDSFSIILPDAQGIGTYSQFQGGAFARYDFRATENVITGRGDAFVGGIVVLPGTDADTGEGRVTGYPLGASAPPFDLAVGPDPVRALTVEADIATGSIAVASLNAGDNSLTIHAGLGTGNFDTRTDFPLPGAPIDATPFDFDGDGDTDLAVVTGLGVSTVTIFENDGALNFSPITSITSGRLDGEATRVFAGDINRDGFGEVIASVRSTRALQVVGNHAGMLDFGEGCATGDYFLDLNVFGTSGTPDPVFTLNDEYLVWRTLKAGVADAVRSGFERPLRVQTFGAASVPLRLRDIEGVDVSAAALVEAEAIGPGVGVTGVRAVGPGLYEVDLAGGTTPTDAAIRVTITQGDDRVILMPNPVVRVYETLADVNLDGLTNATDINAFVKLYLAGDPLADIDGDGDIDEADVSAFVAAFVGPGVG